MISQETVERHLADPKIFFQLKREVRLMAADKKVRVEVKYKNEASEQATRIDTLIQAQRKRKREQEEKWAEVFFPAIIVRIVSLVSVVGENSTRKRARKSPKVNLSLNDHLFSLSLLGLYLGLCSLFCIDSVQVGT